ncbi:unnamed protein product [Rotaria magnacalcarata]|uniref:Metalloendopeptidase n=1 Tax=Rotaria magnacalcarata TaxID=392030 RepID=A0A816UU37_9BILA|nr:unnamed protein product [Rotaria magnacalcarata]
MTRMFIATTTIITMSIFMIVVNSDPSPIFISPPKTNDKVEETPGAFEGDIILPPQSLLRGLTRIGSSVQWPDGIVPYEIMPGYQAEQETIIINSMRKIESLTAINNVRCIQFRPRDVSDLYYTIIQNGTGCSSPVGRQTNGGVFINGTVTLQYPGCIDVGRIMHELLHTLGFYHEQSRPDRDDYVVVHSDTIQAGLEGNFLKYDNTAADTLHSSYDYSSIMHYEKTAFSKNGSFTIEPLQPNIKIGQRYKLTSTDIQHIRLFYNCTGVGTSLPSTTTATTTISSTINKQYNSDLTIGSPTYARMNGFGTNYYYEQIEATVSIAGFYTFKCTSVLDTFATIYGGSYNASSNPPQTPILVVDDENNDNWEFSFSITFGNPGTITVLVTTYSPGVTGAYTIDASGPSDVNFVPVSASVTSTTTSTTTDTSTSTTTTTTTDTSTSTTTTTATDVSITASTTTHTSTTTSTTTDTSTTTTTTTDTSTTTTTTTDTSTTTTTTTDTSTTTSTTTDTSTTTSTTMGTSTTTTVGITASSTSLVSTSTTLLSVITREY